MSGGVGQAIPSNGLYVVLEIPKPERGKGNHQRKEKTMGERRRKWGFRRSSDDIVTRLNGILSDDIITSLNL